MSTGLVIYVGIVLAAAIYQGYRGFRFQWRLGIKEVKTTCDRILLLCCADTIFYAVCSAAGFGGLWLAFDNYAHLPSVTELSPSAAVLLLSLALFGLLGVTGQLPPLIQLGKLLPGVGSGLT